MNKRLRFLPFFVFVRLQEILLRTVLRWQWARHSAALRAAPDADNFDVVISLTSYPPRFECLHLTLQSLLLQSYQRSKVVLWIAHQDIPRLPADVTRLTAYGLEINACDDTRSYKKLLPALKKYPTLPIVIADDDTYYWRDWLAQLVDLWRSSGPQQVVCHRMHRITHNAEGLPNRYTEWEEASTNPDASVDHFPTGIGGVLYAPGILPPAVFDQQSFSTLCPTGDDIWFYWMARSNGATFRCAQRADYFHNWRGSQATALTANNVGNHQNDQQIRAMIARFGYFPSRQALQG